MQVQYKLWVVLCTTICALAKPISCTNTGYDMCLSSYFLIHAMILANFTSCCYIIYYHWLQHLKDSSIHGLYFSFNIIRIILFLIIYLSNKYSLTICYIEEEISSKLTNIKIYLNRNPEFCLDNMWKRANRTNNLLSHDGASLWLSFPISNCLNMKMIPNQTRALPCIMKDV